MRKDTEHNAEAIEDKTADDSGEWMDKYPSETITEVVPIDDVTAGVDVTRYDLESAGGPPLFEIKENYPPEDDVDEESAVYFHGEHAAAQVAVAIMELQSGRFDEYPWGEEA